MAQAPALLTVHQWFAQRKLLAWIVAVLLTFVAFGLRWEFDKFVSGSPFITFIAAVAIAGFFLGTAPSIAVAALSAALAAFFFVPPFNSFVLSASATISVAFYVGVSALLIVLTRAFFVSAAALERAQAELEHANMLLTARLAERTDALKAETAEKVEVESRLNQLMKLEGLGQLTGGIAHDFNNMLSVIIGSLDLARRKLEGSDQRVARLIENALEAAKRSAQLTARLLAFSRQQPLAPKPIDANSVVSSMAEMLRRTLGEHIRVETVLAGGLWSALADAPQLENAILNLAINSCDAMPDGGKLTIETANAELDERSAQSHAEVSAGQYVLVCVSDTGTGMTEQVANRAFDPFFTTKGVGKGTGLGLSQVYGYVKQSGGHVTIYSEVGEGTTVKLYLPRVFDNPEATSPRDNADYPSGSPEIIILLVEDQDHVRHATTDSLRELGYTVVSASGADQALAILEAQPRIDLLFTDIVMPEVNGRQLADMVRSRSPATKILFTTGFTRNAVVHDGKLDPGVALLSKPFTLEQLAHKVREVLHG